MSTFAYKNSALFAPPSLSGVIIPQEMAFGDKSVMSVCPNTAAAAAADSSRSRHCQGINLHPPIKLIGKREKKRRRENLDLGRGGTFFHTLRFRQDKIKVSLRVW